MTNLSSQTKKIILAALLGTIGGGVLVAVATRAVPKIMSGMMEGMMRNMMSRMKESGCAPPED